MLTTPAPPSSPRRSTDDWLEEMGADLRARRIAARLTQVELAEAADVGSSTVKNLESGKGAQLSSLVKVVRALDAEDWLAALALPAPTVSPMAMLRAQRAAARPRQRVRRSRAPS